MEEETKFLPMFIVVFVYGLEPFHRRHISFVFKLWFKDNFVFFFPAIIF